VNFGSGNGGTNDGDGNAATCLANNNCNWARLDVQMKELGVAVQTRDLIKEMAGLHQAGYNLTAEQNILLHSAVQAINSGSADVVSAIDRLASGINSAKSSDSDSFNGFLSGLDDMFKGYFGSGGSGSSGGSSGSGSCEGDDCVPGGLGAGDTSGLGSKANSLISGGGRGFAPYTNAQINALIPASIPSGGKCPVVSESITIGKKTIPIKIDFNNLVPGLDFDLALFMKSILLITVYFINCMSMLAIFRSGGHK